jgi:hypothetical protein
LSERVAATAEGKLVVPEAKETDAADLPVANPRQQARSMGHAAYQSDHREIEHLSSLPSMVDTCQMAPTIARYYSLVSVFYLAIRARWH